ncbi:cob(I)yrinic acid a,c-diamide adenosyltransferase [Candidatus Omnitrophota bacterium]
MLHIYYGKGKGKTSAALGLILRAAGRKRKIILFQFLKPKGLFSGEYASLKKFPNVKQVRFDQKHPIFMVSDKEKQICKIKTHIRKSMSELSKIIRKKSFDILVCDEMLNLIDCGFIKEKDIIAVFNKIKDKKEVILTGRKKPKKLTAIADYVTEFRLIKHPFQRGILARKNIEY